MNPNDKIRQKILQFFYERNANATSQYGKKGYALKISNTRKALKERHDLKQQEVISNLTYLIDKDWINKTEVEKTMQIRGNTIPSTTMWYEISSAGIDKIEGESEFQSNARYAGININATGTNVITLGDGNLVNAQFEGLHKLLENLKKEIASSDKIDDRQKLDLAVDIECIRDQLAKQEPNKPIVKQLWSGVEKVVTGAGLVSLITQISPLIAGLCN